MGYAKEIYQKAQRALDESRAAAQQDAQRRARRPLCRAAAARRDRAGAFRDGACRRAGRDRRRRGRRKADRTGLRARNLALQERRAEILRDAGRPADALAVRYACPVCQDTGYIGQKQCACLQKLLRELACESLGDTSGMRDCRFENFDLAYYPVEPCGPYNVVPRRAMEKVLSACANTRAPSPQERKPALPGRDGARENPPLAGDL